MWPCEGEKTLLKENRTYFNYSKSTLRLVRISSCSCWIVIHWEHTKSICCSCSEPCTSLCYLTGLNVPNWGVMQPPALSPHGENKGNPVWIGELHTICWVVETEMLWALPNQFNHLLLPRCTACPVCDWLGLLPASIQFFCINAKWVSHNANKMTWQRAIIV